MSIKTVQSYSVQANGLRDYIPETIFTPAGDTWKRNPAWLPMTGFNYSIDSTFNTNAGSGPNGSILYDACKLQSDGKILVGGAFTSFNGSTQNKIIRLNTNGTKDTSFSIGTGFSGVGDQVYSITIQSDGKILVGGPFTIYNGTTSNRIIRLNSDGSIDSSFNVGTGFNEYVNVIRVQTDGKILVGGSFTSYNGTTSNRIIRLNSDGSIDSSFNVGTGFPTNTYVTTIAIQSDGKILVGGRFTSYNGNTSKYIIRLNVNGAVDSSFSVANTEPFKSITGNPDGTLKILIDSYNKIVVGGYYGASVKNLLRLNSDGSADESFITGTFNNSGILNMEFQQDKILVVGDFTTYNNVSTGGTGLARINYYGQQDTILGLGTGFGNFTRAVLTQTDNKILVFGEFSTYQGSTISSRIARLNVTEEKVSIVKAVFPQSDFASFKFAGNYTVDWGDGNVINYSANTIANHQYFYAQANLANTNGNVTFLDSGDYVFRSNHGYANTDVISFANITTTTGITVDTPYYVINANTSYFKLSNTSGGSAVTLTTDGSGFILPYKQVVINITPQAGANIVVANLTSINSTIATIYESGFLDIAVSGPNLGPGGATFELGKYTNYSTVFHNMCESVSILNFGNVSYTPYLFSNLTGLKYVAKFDSSKLTDMQYWFNNCFSIESIPELDTTNVTNMYAMFSGCVKLLTIPAFNTPNLTYMGPIFSGCTNLRKVPLFDTSNVQAFTQTFFNCRSLTEVPLFNTQNVTSFYATFMYCYRLKSIPLFNTSKGNDWTYTFYNCFSLKEIPLLNTASATSMTSMFLGCSSLETLPLLNLSKVTDATNFLSGCYALKKVPKLDTSKVTDARYFFNECRNLETLEDINFSSSSTLIATFQGCVNLRKLTFSGNTSQVTNLTTAFYNCTRLESVPLFDTSKVTDMSSMFYNCFKLSNLPVFNTANVTNMEFTFYNCSSLANVPAFNTSKVTSMASTFGYCTNLQSIPFFDTSQVTNMNSMFNGCYTLQFIPKFDTANVTTMDTTFYNCRSLTTLPTLDTAKVTVMSSMLGSCLSLRTVPAFNANSVTAMTNTFYLNRFTRSLISNVRVSHSYENNFLGNVELNEIYTNLPTVSGQTITVTNNWGTASDDPTIATAKGWTVVG